MFGQWKALEGGQELGERVEEFGLSTPSLLGCASVMAVFPCVHVGTALTGGSYPGLCLSPSPSNSSLPWPFSPRGGNAFLLFLVLYISPSLVDFLTIAHTSCVVPSLNSRQACSFFPANSVRGCPYSGHSLLLGNNIGYNLRSRSNMWSRHGQSEHRITQATVTGSRTFTWTKLLQLEGIIILMQKLPRSAVCSTGLEPGRVGICSSQ